MSKDDGAVDQVQEAPEAELRISYEALGDVLRWPRNPKLHADEQLDQSLQRFGYVAPMIVDEGTGRLVAGHGRVDRLAARKAAGGTPPGRVKLREGDGEWLVPVVRGVRFANADEAEAYLIADNRLVELGGWGADLLPMLERVQLTTDQLQGVGYSATDVEDLKRQLERDQDGAGGASGNSGAGAIVGSLQARFVVPPFSVFDARMSYWTERKKLWRSLGFEGGAGRGGNLWGLSDNVLQQKKSTKSGTSVFDPVLCEIVLRWFCPEGGAVLDPFAGGCTSGIVASVLGRRFTGIELRAEQVAANVKQARRLGIEPAPRWLQADSARMGDALEQAEAFDLLWTDPPYFSLERYSEQEGDGSGSRDYVGFIGWLEGVLVQAIARLRQDRFAVLKIGEVRSPRGGYLGFVPDCIGIMRRAGLMYVNEAILVTPAGSLPMRCQRAFHARRTLGKTHQNVLVFCKGDARKAARALAPMDIAVTLPDAFTAQGSGGDVEEGLVSDEAAAEAEDHGSDQDPVKG